MPKSSLSVSKETAAPGEDATEAEECQRVKNLSTEKSEPRKSSLRMLKPAGTAGTAAIAAIPPSAGSPEECLMIEASDEMLPPKMTL